ASTSVANRKRRNVFVCELSAREDEEMAMAEFYSRRFLVEVATRDCRARPATENATWRAAPKSLHAPGRVADYGRPAREIRQRRSPPAIVEIAREMALVRRGCRRPPSS